MGLGSPNPGGHGWHPGHGGHPLPARTVAALYRNGHTVQGILALYPHLSREQIEDALALHRLYPPPISDEEWQAFQQAICDHLSADGIDQTPLSDPEKVWWCVGCGWLFQSKPDPERPWVHRLTAAPTLDRS